MKHMQDDYITKKAMENKNPIQVAEKLFAVLELLSKNGECGLIEISKSLDLNKATVHRLLTSLIMLGYVNQNTETLKYRPTYKICYLSSKILENNDVVTFCKPYLKRIAEYTGETVHLVKLIDKEAVYIDKVEGSTNSIRLVSRVGKTIPLYCSGVGKALMAYMSDEEIIDIFNKSEIITYTTNTITDVDTLLKTVETVRKNGYALDNEEMEKGVKCVAVAMHDFDREPLYALSISAPKDRMTNQIIAKYTNYLLEIKKEIEDSIISIK